MWPNDNLKTHQWKAWFFETQTWYFEKNLNSFKCNLDYLKRKLDYIRNKIIFGIQVGIKLYYISVLNRPFHEFNKLGKICRQHWKERLKISEIVSSAKSRNFTDVCVVWDGGRGHICVPHNTNVCKISRLCGGAISSLVFNKSLSNLAILLILIEKNRERVCWL